MSRMLRIGGAAILVAAGLGCSDRVAPGSEEGGNSTTGASTDGGASSAGVDATTTAADDSTSDAVDSTGVETTGTPLQCGLEEAAASLELWSSEWASDAYYYFGVRRQLDPSLPVVACIYRTLIVVENDVVVRRRMDPWVPSGEHECAAGWDEVGDELGSHAEPDDGLPAPVWTLDEVYASCCELLADPPQDWNPAFFANDEGLIERCLVSYSFGSAEMGPYEWGDQIWIDEIGLGPPPE